MTDETKTPIDPHAEHRMARRADMERYQKAADDTQAGLLNAKKWYLDACHGELMAWLQERKVELAMDEDDVFIRFANEDEDEDKDIDPPQMLQKALLI